MKHYLIDFLVIALACFTVEAFFLWYEHHLKKSKEEFLCDLCNKPRVLRSTKDKKLWLCRQCARIYKKE